MKIIDKYELIEQYLLGTLSGDSLEQFNLEMKNNSNFASEVERQKQLFSIIEDASFVEVGQRLKNIHLKQTTYNPFVRKLGWGLGTATIIIATVLYFSLNKKPLNQITENNIDTAKSVKKEKVVIADEHTKTANEETSHKEIIETKTENKPIVNNQSIPIETKVTQTNPTVNQNTPLDIIADAKLKTSEPVTIDISDQVQQKTTDIDNVESKSNLLVSEKKVDCNSYTITAEVKTDPACKTDSDGKITILENTIKGGEKPYSFSLKPTSGFRQNNVIDGLYEGHYSVFVKDHNNCPFELGYFKVESVDCETEFIFAPGNNEPWEIPNRHKPGTLQVFSKRGILVYEQTIDEFSEKYWDGRSLNGDELPTGLYSFFINYNDGDVFAGTVTIKQ